MPYFVFLAGKRGIHLRLSRAVLIKTIKHLSLFCIWFCDIESLVGYHIISCSVYSFLNFISAVPVSNFLIGLMAFQNHVTLDARYNRHFFVSLCPWF